MERFGRRMHGGGALSVAQATNFSFVALYNDSSAGHILRVMNWVLGLSGGARVWAFFATATVGAFNASGIPLFSGERQGAGSIYIGNNATSPPQTYLINGIATFAQAPELVPWFYVRPGFSLVFKSDTINIGVNVGFVWEDLEMSMLRPNELA